MFLLRFIECNSITNGSTISINNINMVVSEFNTTSTGGKLPWKSNSSPSHISSASNNNNLNMMLTGNHQPLTHLPFKHSYLTIP